MLNLKKAGYILRTNSALNRSGLSAPEATDIHMQIYSLTLSYIGFFHTGENKVDIQQYEVLVLLFL